MVIIEEFLEGIEMSYICLVSNNKLIPLESARDYKKAYDNDEGLNTGGMGCFSPNDILTKELENTIKKEILNNIEVGFKNENIKYNGVLFIGLMINNSGPKVLEFNVRFGDPETEVILPRLKNDIVEVFQKSLKGTLKSEDLIWDDRKSVTVILASGGYPISYEKGKTMKGLKDLDKDIIAFHCGTKSSDNETLTNGGRVLAITNLGKSIDECREKIYSNINKINFDGVYFRSDIGK